MTLRAARGHGIQVRVIPPWDEVGRRSMPMILGTGYIQRRELRVQA